MSLLEREHCLAALTRHLHAAADGAGCFVLIGGEAGIGKTSVLQHFTRELRDTRVLWGACDALFTPRPLAPLHDIARMLPGELAKALNAGAGREIIFNAVLDELERTPTLAVFEDLHWADEATLDLVKFLGRRIQRSRSMIVVTYRDDEVGAQHPLRFVIGDLPRTSTHRILLAPLSATAVAQLAVQAERSSKGLHDITGGNPLFVTEVLASAPAQSVPVTVRDAVLARATRLSSSARSIAELVSVIPNKTEEWLLTQATQPDEASIASCLSIGLVRHDDGALAFRHELARRAFEDSLSITHQQNLHSKILAALQQRSDVSAARLSHHAGGARNAQAVLHFAPIAATQAAMLGSHREAAAHLRLALHYADSLVARPRAHLYEQLSYECYLTNQIEHAVEARMAALEIWRAVGNRHREGDSLRWLSRLNWFFGRRAEADQYAVDSVAVLEPLGTGIELAMAYSNRAQLEMLAHNADATITWAQRAIALAETLGADEVLSHALNNLGTARAVSGDEDGWIDLERSLDIALQRNFQEHIARAYTNLCSSAVVCHQAERAARYISAGLAYCEQHDLDSWRLYILAASSRFKFDRGDWAGAAIDAEAVLENPNTAPITRVPALIVLGHLRIRRADPDPATPLEEARSFCATMQELQRSGPLAAAIAEAAWFADDHARIVAEVNPLYLIAQRHQDPWMKGELAVWLWRAGALKESPADIAEPYREEISGRWQQAASTWQSLGYLYDQACVLAWNGDEPAQREALSIFERLGAAAASQVLRKRMRDQGVRSIPRGSRASTRSNAFGLTKREREILDLLAEGLRNAEIAARIFLSTKTVDHHVSAILAKLGASSRAQAVAIASKL